MAGALGPEKCIALPFLLAFSGCDTVSSFAGRGKRTVWEIWKIFNEVTPAFCTLASTPDPSSVDDQLEVLECIVVLLYDRASTEVKVNETQKLCSPRKADQWMAFHQLKLHLWNTQRELPTSPVMSGHDSVDTQYMTILQISKMVNL